MQKASPQLITNWLQEVLPEVTKPARYLGNEVGAVRKDGPGLTRMAFAFADIYEVGMSHLGIKLLYDIINKQDDLVCERVFAPWTDLEAKMRADGIPLWSLESRTPLCEFDVVGFTLQYELSFSNILNMLDLSGIPLKAAQRDSSHPIVVGGGPVAYNPEPLADFFDCFLIGDGEESIVEFLRAVKEWRSLESEDRTKNELYARLVRIPGCYVPSLYEVSYSEDGRVSGVTPTGEGVPTTVVKRIVKNLDDAPGPSSIPVPYMDIVHDRIMLEVMRGCGRGCRFCQAGMVYRPVRERSASGVCDLAGALLAQTGYEELSLSSLSTADHSEVEPMFRKLLSDNESKNVSVSLPSLRADAFSLELAKMAQAVRKTGLTFAPEAGTQRLRDAINKGVTEEGLLEAVSAAFAAGWDSVKLYFMIGLPTETDEDVLGIAELAKKAALAARDAKKAAGRKGRIEIGISVSSFVPKSHTPFQWFPQDSIEELERKQRLLADASKSKGLSLNWHDAKTSHLEAIFARGDRRLGEVIFQAWRQGCKFDGWEEHFKFNTWLDVMHEQRLSPAFYANRERELDEVLPWDHISAGVSKQFLVKEWRQALAAMLTPDCRSGRCGGCGVCKTLDTSPVFASQEDSFDAQI